MKTNKLMKNSFSERQSYLFIFAFFLFLMSFSAQSVSQVLSNSAVKPITKAQEMMSEGEYFLAAESLSAFLAKNRLKDYDRAKALQLLAIVYMNLDDNKNAVEKIEQALSLNALEKISASQLRQNLFSLYAIMENYEAAVKHLDIWFADQEMPSTENYFLAGRIYGLSEDWIKASEFVEKGYVLLKKDQKTSLERSWLELTLTVRMQLNKLEMARMLLEEMISYWPDHYSYYQQLSGIYHSLKQEKEAFAIMNIAKQNGLVNSKNDLERLVQLHRYFENPYTAANILQKTMLSDDFEGNESFFESLANTWMQAREWSEAESALFQAATLSNKGEHWLRLCQTNFQRASFENALQYCDEAIAKGGLKKEESVAWYLLALSKQHLDDKDGAHYAFTECAALETTSSPCKNWLDIYAKNEEKRKREEKLLLEVEINSKRGQQDQNERIESALKIMI